MHYEDDNEALSEKLNINTWKKILKVILKSKKPLVFMIIAVIFMSSIDVFYPILNRYALNEFFVENDFSNKYLFISLYAAAAVMMGLSVFWFIRAAAVVEESTTYEMRKQAFHRLQELSFSYFDTTPSGWVMARMTSDARKLSTIISWGLVDFLWGFILMGGILVASFIIDYRLALLLLAMLPIFMVVAIVLNRKILKEYREVRKINSSITASYNESFMGANTSKTLVLEKENEEEFTKIANRMRNRSIKAAMWSSLIWPIILVIGYYGVGLVSIIGGNLVIVSKGIFSVSTLYLFIDYAIRFFDPVIQIARVLADFQQAQASAERVISLIETDPDVYDKEEVISKYGDLLNHKKENWEKINGEIEFKNVSFKYKGTDTYVLKDFNLKIKAGEMVALVGETGSGKSTIVNLISRFYEPTEGEILIDGINYKERSISWLHSNLGYVLQTPQLFSTSIEENIRYGKLDATHEEIEKACKIANATNFIEKLDKGYDTLVGEGGSKLSVGERQLISFARAIVADPAILVLDEATSSIDTENEKVILEAIHTILKERTSLVVAHRLSTIVDADKIIVLKHGQIIESGTHKELLNQKGYYFDLYRNQFMQEKTQKMFDEI
ncbi:MAG: ABC transporter ATP-binding protein [Bacilli bacterium]|nr:ABC transporter ATP-binding protein [Bacilli bacterium]